MTKSRIALLALAIALPLASGCREKPSRWDEAAANAASAEAKKKDEPKPVEGSSFNKFFPPEATGGYKRIYSQERTGFAEAKLQKDGAEIAVLSISDTANNPDARSKFASAGDKVSGYPLITVGKNQSSVLVKDRWQVKVSSQKLDEAARKSLLAEFDLAGLAGL